MKKNLFIAVAAAVAIAAGIVTVQALAGADQAVKTAPQPDQPVHIFDKQIEVKTEPDLQSEEKRRAERAQEPSKIVETDTHSSQSTQTPAASQPAAEGGHIPFTNEPVTAGDPESYVGTVGQCPFYEMAGDKGCVPPSDIECNADWSQCKLKSEGL